MHVGPRTIPHGLAVLAAAFCGAQALANDYSGRHTRTRTRRLFRSATRRERVTRPSGNLLPVDPPRSLIIGAATRSQVLVGPPESACWQRRSHYGPR